MIEVHLSQEAIDIFQHFRRHKDAVLDVNKATRVAPATILAFEELCTKGLLEQPAHGSYQLTKAGRGLVTIVLGGDA